MSRCVWLLGSLRVEQAGESLSLSGSKLVNLFTFLILHPNTTHRRERLADWLFPDASPERASRNFSALLYRLRQLLGAAWVETTEEYIALRTEAELWVDVWEFERLAGNSDLAALQRAIELYRDDLAPEIYDDWILPRRAALREKFLHALARVAEHAERTQDYARAFEFFHRLAFADPLNEDAQRGLMRVYARLGRHAAALQQYDQLTRLLADELHIEPLPETRALAEAIRAEHHVRGADIVAEKPFVGRQRERARLTELVERAQSGRGGLAFVEGEAGIGKTRLLESVAEGAAWRGVTVVWGRARELTGITPFAPLNEAWRAACAGPRVEQLRARLAPALCHALAGLEPRLRTSAPSANPPNVADALAEGVRALADLAPHLFILDDVQWADPSFWDALAKLAPQIAAQRVCLILAYRADEVRTNEIAWRALRDLDRECAPLRLTLNGLSATECAELAHALGQSLDETAARALHQHTNGNPLFAQALLQGEPADQASYTELIERRLARLSPAARAALDAGAVLGREFTHGAWQALAGAGVLAAIPTLVAEHFIQETSSGYCFEHDLTREFVYRAQSAEHRRELHRRAGVVLAQEHAEPSVLAFRTRRRLDGGGARVA